MQVAVQETESGAVPQELAVVADDDDDDDDEEGGEEDLHGFDLAVGHLLVEAWLEMLRRPLRGALRWAVPDTRNIP